MWRQRMSLKCGPPVLFSRDWQWKMGTVQTATTVYSTVCYCTEVHCKQQQLFTVPCVMVLRYIANSNNCLLYRMLWYWGTLQTATTVYSTVCYCTEVHCKQQQLFTVPCVMVLRYIANSNNCLQYRMLWYGGTLQTATTVYSTVCYGTERTSCNVGRSEGYSLLFCTAVYCEGNPAFQSNIPSEWWNGSERDVEGSTHSLMQTLSCPHSGQLMSQLGSETLIFWRVIAASAWLDCSYRSESCGI
jgi:hypothetical protein